MMDSADLFETNPDIEKRIMDGDFDGFLIGQYDRYDWLPRDVVTRYARAYGTRMDRMLEGAGDIDSMGRHFGDHVYEAEIDYLIRMEWAKTAEDILWRRSKLGLHVSEQTKKNLESFMDARQMNDRTSLGIVTAGAGGQG